MKMLVRALLVSSLVAANAQAQTPTPAKRPMTFADLQAIKRISDPQISPSGKWVLFSVTDVALEKNTKTNHLWVVPLDGSAKEVQLTRATGESNGRFSPDGKSVLYTGSDETGKSQIFIASWNDTAGTIGYGFNMTKLETEADGAIWAPDSKHFLFVSSVYPECESHAAMGPQRDSEEAGCNALKDAVAAKNPVKALVFDHLLYRHWNSYVGAKHSHIFYGSVEKPTPDAPTDLTPASVIGDHEAPTFSLGGPLGYGISPDGKEVAYVTNLDKVPAASTNNDIFVLQVGAEPKTAKKVSTSPGSDDGPQYSPDGKWLAWRSQARNGFESDQFRLAVMDRSSGQTSVLMTKSIPHNGPLMGVPAFDLWVDEFIWTHDSKYFLFVSGEKGEAPVYRVNLEGTDLHRLGKVRGEWSSIAETPDQMIVGTLMRVDSPNDVVYTAQQDIDDTTRTFNLDFRKPGYIDLTSRQRPAEETTTENVEAHKLTHLNDDLISKMSLASLDPFWFTGAANAEVEGFLIKPPNFDPTKKYPVKFLMHGGPQTAWGDSWSYRWNWELMAANGYVVVGINRRGSTGYGQKFVDEVSGDWGGKAYTDLMKGLDYAEAHYPFIDKNRECALGASYGGFMANWVLTHTDRFKCIVTHDGMYNPQSAYGTTEEMWFNEWEFRPIVRGVGNADSPAARKNDNKKDALLSSGMVEQTRPAQPWDYFGLSNDADPFRKFSPMLHIRNAHTPTLVIHSQRDYRLDVSEGFQLFTALQRLGVPSKMLYFPDEGHWVLKPQNSQLWYETVNDWCDRWLGMNKYAGVGPEKNPMSAGTRGQGPGASVQKTASPKAGMKSGAQDKTDK